MHIKLSKNVKLTLSILFIFIGLSLLLYIYFSGIKKNLFNVKNLEYIEYIAMNENIPEDVNAEEVIYEPAINEVEETLPEEKTVVDEITNYIGYLEIPKIEFKRGFVDINSAYNNVDLNIAIIKGSTMPDVENGNFLLAGHYGNSAKSFFKNLHKLVIGDRASINYKNKVYDYELVNIYKEKKDGVLTIRRNASKTTLTLITCSKGDNSTQTIFIFELKEVK